MNTYDYLKRNKDNYTKYFYKFDEVFGTSLKHFMNPIYGFDIIKFDEWLKTPDNISTMEYTTEKYGKIGVEMIEKLIGVK